METMDGAYREFRSLSIAKRPCAVAVKRGDARLLAEVNATVDALQSSGKLREMSAQPRCGGVGIHVEGIGAQAGDRRPAQATPEYHDEAVVGDVAPLAAPLDTYVALGDGNTSYGRDDGFDADRVQHVGERHADVAEIGFVVADADGVEGIGVHHRNPDRLGADPALVERTGGADRRPQAG